MLKKRYPPELTADFESQTKTENVASGGDGDVLVAMHRETHGRRGDALAGMEMPEGCACAGVNCFERFCVVPEKDQAASGGHRASAGPPGTHLRIFPGRLGSGKVVRQQDLFARIAGTAFRTGCIVHVSRNEFFGSTNVNAAVFRSQKI